MDDSCGCALRRYKSSVALGSDYKRTLDESIERLVDRLIEEKLWKALLTMTDFSSLFFPNLHQVLWNLRCVR